jgi:hypothetical protein
MSGFVRECPSQKTERELPKTKKKTTNRTLWAAIFKVWKTLLDFLSQAFCNGQDGKDQWDAASFRKSSDTSCSGVDARGG